MSGQILSLLAGMVRVAIPISFAALAGMLSERAGVINMGLEGIMLIGSFFGVVGSYVTGSAWMGLLFAALSGILMGLVLVTLTVGFKCEHVLAGVGINIFASGITIVLLEMIWGTKGKASMVAGLGMLRVPVISKIPVIGDIIGTISPLFYILVLCVFLLWFLLYRTPAGLRILVIGENIKVRRFARYDTGLNVPYVHMGGRIAVLVNLETESTDAAVVELGKDIAMQIAALNPTYKDKSDVSEEFIEKEKEIRLAQAKEDPKNAKKPDAIIEKIVMGGIGKYFKEICLLQQPFVKDDKVSVEEHIAAVAKQVGASIKLVNYTRFEKGEGIEKRQDDLAEEVAKLIK